MKRPVPKTLRSLRKRALPSRAGDESPQRLRFAAEIPGGAAGPLWKLQVEALTEPGPGGGERLRLRAHLQTNLASVVKPALAALGTQSFKRLKGPGLSTGTALAPFTQKAGRWLGEWAQARAEKLAPRLSRWAAPLLSHDHSTWLELHASSAPLVEGAKALLPNAEKLSQLGITPDLGPNAPAVQNWHGRIGDEAAQVSLLRLDERQLPENLRAQLRGQPFQLAAAVVNVITRKP